MKINAMVVDDSGIMRKMVMRSLTEAGLAEFNFIEAGDGREALQAFDGDKVNMCFVDWNMPNMSGIEFVKAIRATQKRHIPIVMVTTESTVAKVEEALDEAGVDCYIVKPFTVETLQKKLKPLFDKVSGAGGGEKKGGFFGKLVG
jgi:two-component system chemotaxis response regulator CheY